VAAAVTGAAAAVAAAAAALAGKFRLASAESVSTFSFQKRIA
jgi:hypothetical protein